GRRKRRCVAPLTAHSRLCRNIGGDGGYITTEPSAGGAGPLGTICLEVWSSYLSFSIFFGAFDSSGGCFSFHSSSKVMICSFILAGVASLPKYFSSSAIEIITPRSSFFFSL